LIFINLKFKKNGHNFRKKNTELLKAAEAAIKEDYFNGIVIDGEKIPYIMQNAKIPYSAKFYNYLNKINNLGVNKDDFFTEDNDAGFLKSTTIVTINNFMEKEFNNYHNQLNPMADKPTIASDLINYIPNYSKVDSNKLKIESEKVFSTLIKSNLLKNIELTNEVTCKDLNNANKQFRHDLTTLIKKHISNDHIKVKFQEVVNYFNNLKVKKTEKLISNEASPEHLAPKFLQGSMWSISLNDLLFPDLQYSKTYGHKSKIGRPTKEIADQCRDWFGLSNDMTDSDILDLIHYAKVSVNHIQYDLIKSEQTNNSNVKKQVLPPPVVVEKPS